MLKPIVRAGEAAAPYNGYDSVLEKPSGANPQQNAWLTLQLRVKLNFVDSKNPAAGKTYNSGANYFAKDWSGYLFPILDWPPHLVKRFEQNFVQRAERIWNRQFLLKTPKTYADLDVDNLGAGLTIRPNVLCLFRLSIFGPSGQLDSSPASGPLNSGAVHHTINVFNLALGTRQVKLASDVTAAQKAKDGLTETRDFTKIDGGVFRSDADNYSDQDVFSPRMWDPAYNLYHDTIGHEIGHVLGQSHIMGMKGNPKYLNGAADQGVPAAYGEGSPDWTDPWNVMGKGDRLTLINAVSWRERIAAHTGLPANAWEASGMLATPPRTLPAGFKAMGVAPAEW